MYPEKLTGTNSYPPTSAVRASQTLPANSANISQFPAISRVMYMFIRTQRTSVVANIDIYEKLFVFSYSSA